MTASPRVHVVAEAAGRWCRLVLEAPPGNLLSAAMVERVTGAVADARTVPALKWLTLEGAGGQFSYGASIPEHLPEPMPQVLTSTHALIRALLAFPAPTCALVDGRCLGGGFELALACDDIIASTTAEFGLPEIALAAFPPVAAALLPVRVGASRASRAIVTGEVRSAAYWNEAGLMACVADSVAVVDAARSWFERHFAPRSAVALSHAARATRAVWLPAVERAIAINERRYLDEVLATSDAVEGITAWMEKRPAEWRDD